MNAPTKYRNVDPSIGNICPVSLTREIIRKTNSSRAAILRLIFIYKKPAYKLICESGVL